jgi:hypothetical protein
LIYRNKEKIRLSVFIWFFVLATSGALIMCFDINVNNIKGLFEASVSPQEGFKLSYNPNVDEVAMAIDTTKAEIIDTIKEDDRLYIEPIQFIFYKPEKPQTETQIKAKIVALAKNASKEIAKNVKFNFIVGSGKGGIVSSKEWNERIGRKTETFNMEPNSSALLSWTPDVPPRRFYIDNRDKYITLTVEVEWEYPKGKFYKSINSSNVKYDEENDNFYFEITNKAYYELGT